MRAMRVYRPHPLDDDQRNPLVRPPLLPNGELTPEPGPGQVRIKVSTCGVCHTDLHIVEGELHPPALPVTPGHQVVGVVDAIGPEPTTVFEKALGVGLGIAVSTDPHTTRRQPLDLHLGDRVGVPWLYAACGECEYCQSGRENLCPLARFTGFHVDGGYAEYMLADSRYVLPLPASLSDEKAAPLLCAGIIGYRSLRLADLQHGETLGLVGFGASAHLAIQVARAWDCPVYVFTRSEQHQRYALDLGAAWAGTIEKEAPGPVDRAIIFAPSGALVPPALEKLRPGGTLAINAVYMSDLPPMPYSLLYGERTVRSVANATYQDGLDFLTLAGEIPLQIDTTAYPLEDANHALLDLKESKLNGEAVLYINEK